MLLATLALALSFAQGPADWHEPFPAHKIVGNVYYVGSRDLATYLITTPEGHILINSGFDRTVPLIQRSVESLGFKITDVKILLASHAHSDHVAGLARLKDLTGAKVYIMRGDDQVIAAGGKGQYMYTTDRWEPCKVDRVLKDGNEVKLGGVTLIARLTPGHTRGCTTWTWMVEDGGKKHDVVVIGSPNVNPGFRLVNNKDYPEIADDFSRTFTVLKSLPCDVFLGAHGSYYGMVERHALLKKGKVNPFINPAGYKEYVSLKERAFRKTLAAQKDKADRDKTGGGAPPAVAAISDTLRQSIAAKEIAGAVTLVATPDRVLHLNATGNAVLNPEQPMQTDAIFWIASMSKPVLGTLLLMLQDEGLLSVDDPVEKYLPEFKGLKTADGKLARVTIRHLLTHTSGLSEITREQARKCKTLADVIPLYVAQPVRFTPGSKWVYCQSGINTGGRIAEVVTGEPLEKLMKRKLFDSLGMKDTTFYLTEKQLPRLAKSYRRTDKGDLEATDISFLGGKSPTSTDRFPAPNGGLFSTASDYARFCRMVLRGGELDGKRFLKPETVELMTAIHTAGLRTGFTPGNGWGLGWCVIREPQGITAMLSPGTFGHGGAYGTQAWIDPETKRVYILMVQRANFPNSDASGVRSGFQQIAATLLSGEQAHNAKLNIPYADPPEKRQVLDVYSPHGAKNLPVVFWIHGGGWVTGDKSSVQLKPKVFMDKGFVFVSTNYRLLPSVDMGTIVRDVAKSIRWVHDHIAEYGGDPKRLLVMGHSAGAQLAALVCTDDRYLKSEGLSLAIIKGCMPVDGDTYDVPAIIETAETRRKVHGLPQAKYGHREKFGNDPAKHKDFSAVTHVAKDKGIPPFLILYVADHPDTGAQAQRLGNVLKAAGVPVTLFGARETNHNKLNANLGLPDDPATKAMFDFVGKALKK
jgi:CubicO group peptidase (beta-lactamase class C family)/glyoxylase-like metal-dependent hydrolase (beta-lactamase superfamily II)